MVFEPVILGRTGVQVGRIGLAAGYGIPADAVDEAVERGVNYLYWGSFRRKEMLESIQRIVRRDRNKIIIVVQIYHRWQWFARRSFERAFWDLGVDYVDVVLLGYHNKRPPRGLLDYVFSLKEKGRVRFLGISTHRRILVPELAPDPAFDIFHIRYNAAHRGAEKDIFPKLPPSDGPGIVVFTATRWGQLFRPRHLQAGDKKPTATDCYRFVLSHPSVHVCMSGPRNLEQTRAALKAIELGPMDPDELAWVRRVGDGVYGKH